MSQNSKDAKAIENAAKEKDYATVETKAKDIMSNLDAVVSLFPKAAPPKNPARTRISG